MKKKHFLPVAIFSLILTACASNPPSYLPSGTTPIVNVEADIAEKIAVDAKPELLKVENLTSSPINIGYKLFWYDTNGVTQMAGQEKQGWLNFWLEPLAKTSWQLTPPTEESVNYRIYLRAKAK